MTFTQLILVFVAAVTVDIASAAVIDVRSTGAVGDGKTMDTAAIQNAIDKANTSGGGIVLLTKGTFLSGTLAMKSHVTLQLEKDATLLGSPRHADYRRNRWLALIIARGQEDMAICGEGVIDGQGKPLAADVERLVAEKKIVEAPGARRPDEKNRPQLIELVDCKNVRITGVTLKNSACWVQTYHNCTDMTLDRVIVRSVAYWNNDGLDLVDCHRVRVTNCDINSADDGICLKSGNPQSACEDIVIENCKVRSSASALKFGTSSRGGFKRIKATNLFVYDTYRSAIALESVDGGVIEDINISNVEAKNTGNAIFIRLGHRNTDERFGTVKNVTISNVRVEVPAGRPDKGYDLPGPEVRAPHNLIPSSITGLPGHPVQSVTLKDIAITYGGGGNRAKAQVDLEKVPEQAARYPEFSMFGELPAWGFYCRHAEGIKFENVTIEFKEKDYRSALVCDDVKGLHLDGFNVRSSGEEPVIVLREVPGAEIRRSPTPAGAKMFIRSDGSSAIR